MLRLANGEEIAGADLARVIEGARSFRRVLDAFPTHYPRHILEHAALAGAFDAGRADADLQAVADRLTERLDMVAVEYERGWQGRITQDHGIRLARVAARRRRDPHPRRRRPALGRGAAAGEVSRPTRDSYCRAVASGPQGPRPDRSTGRSTC